ncbi:MAG: hypothetical protein DLM50_04745, partial [Candidatus Meridianibacter frigidus]
MKRFGTLAVLALLSLAAGPAAARTSFVNDGAGMFGASTVSAIDTRIGNFNAQTGKEVVVETVDSTSATPIKDAAQREFAQQNINGVLIYIAKSDRKDYMVVDHAAASAGWFTSDISRSILQSMETQFRDGDFDGGITSAVGGVLAIYHQHVNSLPNRSAGAPLTTRSAYASPSTNGGFHLTGFWWIVIAVGAFLILRSLMRASSAPRYGPGVPGAPAAGPGYGGPGYYGGGGGGFFSGLLGGLGGAFLGNELFGNRGGGMGGADQGAIGGGNASDAGGWTSDAGQADTG